jgi:UDP-glucose 4-epimerase
MADERIVLVTGAAGYWGNRAAARLLELDGLRVIGVDRDPPQTSVDGLDFIQADLRNPLLVELLAEEKVDTILHLQFRDALTPSEDLFDLNVMGTAKLLAAAGEAGVRQVVLKSSLMVYGARSDNPMFLREDHPHHGSKKYGYLRDWMELEKYAQSFSEQNPDVGLAILRFGHIVGPRADSPMTRFLREEEAITLLGFDPMLQLIHEKDVVAALVHTVVGEYSGAFNVAPEHGMPLWKAMGLAGKVPIPFLHPLAYWSVSLAGLRRAPLPLEYLRYPCMGDMRRMREELEFAPQYTPEEALREFSSQQRARKQMKNKKSDARDEDPLRETIERRRRMRVRANGTRTQPSARAKAG